SADRLDWVRRVAVGSQSLRDPRRGRCRSVYWLVDQGEQVGTLGIASTHVGGSHIGISSVWAERYDWCDMGMPEGLAYKIAVFEAVDREHGYEVRTPRIPELDYHIE